MRARVPSAVVVLLTLAWAAGACGSRPESTAGTLSVAATLSAGDSGYAHATAPRAFRFPADRGPHPAYRNEWWYYTGNLATPAGRRFGFELTFFRSGLTPHPRTRPSAWAASQAYMAHFALTDVRRAAFHAFQRFERGALGLAGARAQPFRLWVEDWSVAAETGGSTEGMGESATGEGASDTGVGGSATGTAAAAAPVLRLRAAADDVAVDLRLRALEPPVANGEDGLSRKGPGPGNASYYYSVPRLAATGTLTTTEGSFPVSGLVWLDREWGTSALGREQVGWDWMGLQLSDGTDLLYYRLRDRDGRASRFSAGTLVLHAAGRTRRVIHLRAGDVELRATGTWRSPLGGVAYPSGWRVSAPADSLSLSIEPLLRDQELRLAYRYWEGAVRISGRHRGRPVHGYGYVELTGYGAAGTSRSSSTP